MRHVLQLVPAHHRLDLVAARDFLFLQHLETGNRIYGGPWLLIIGVVYPASCYQDAAVPSRGRGVLCSRNGEEGNVSAQEEHDARPAIVFFSEF